jgi:hypothetical protein
MIPFTFTFTVPFLVFSIYIVYYFYGDFYLIYYRDFGFIITKLIQSFMRGSLDNIDVETSIDVNISESQNYLKEIFRLAGGPFFSLVNKVGYTGFLVVLT